MVFNWFSQVSFSPRQVAIGLSPKAYSYGLIKESGVFAVNVFAKEDQDDLTKFSKSRAKRPDKMEDSSFTRGPETGCPILEGASAYLECKVINFINNGGDHEILVGEVINAGVLKNLLRQSIPPRGF